MHSMISVTEAWSLIEQHALPDTSVQYPLLEAVGRTLAEPVVSNLNQPPHAVSAMDGYAVRLEDVREAGTKLTVIGEAPAGHPFSGAVEQSQAVRIFTGGYVPLGADHIVMQEDTARVGSVVTSVYAQHTSRFVRKKGLDFAEGDVLLPAGTRLTPQTIALAAAGNVATVSVTEPPRVGVIANGDELKPPGSELKDGEIVNSVAPAICGLIADWGGRPVNLGVVPDSPSALQQAIQSAGDLDLLVTIGGASVGDHDHMKPAFTEAGFDIVFSKIAVRPGKPTWFAKRAKQMVLGLPGNPASALVCANLFLRPMITGKPVTFIPARSSSALAQNGSREHFMRGRLVAQDDGTLTVSADANQDSSLLSPFRQANVLIRRLPNAPAVAASDLVECAVLTSAFLSPDLS